FIWLFYLGCALATLTKGPVGLGMPGLIVVAYLSFSRRWSLFWKRGHPLTGALLYLLVALPWFAAMVWLHGEAYFSQLKADNLGRFLSPMEGHGGTPLFYLPVLFFGFFPWSAFLPFAWFQGLKESRGKEPEDPLSQEFPFLAALWAGIVFIFFTVSATRLPHSIAPLFPAASFWVAHYFAKSWVEENITGLKEGFFIMMGLGLILGGTFLSAPYWLDRALPPDISLPLDWDTGIIGSVLILGSLAAGILGLCQRKVLHSFGMSLVFMSFALFFLLHSTLPQIGETLISPAQEILKKFRSSFASGDRMVFYNLYRPSLIFYAQRKGHFFQGGQEEALKAFSETSGQVFLLLPELEKHSLPEELKNWNELVNEKGYLLLAKKHPEYR
ncbi:MAG: hypothetical protein R3257_06120, partial [bacterium]|nr:hypothetical protein [bacterium]